MGVSSREGWDLGEVPYEQRGELGKMDPGGAGAQGASNREGRPGTLWGPHPQLPTRRPSCRTKETGVGQ